MELRDLIGSLQLSAVDFGELPPPIGYYYSDKSQTMTFVLNGVAYTIVEDPEDGYRSSMREIIVSPDYQPKNRFGPVDVIGQYSGVGEDMLRLISVATGKVILEAGTENTDDYYPYFVANFNPTGI